MKSAKQKTLLWLVTALLLVTFLPIARSAADEPSAESAVNRLLQTQLTTLPFTPTTDNGLVIINPSMNGAFTIQNLVDELENFRNKQSIIDFYWLDQGGNAGSASVVGLYESPGHGNGENEALSAGGGGIGLEDHPGDTSQTAQVKNGALEIETENALIMGTYGGPVRISPSVGQCTLYGVNLADDLQVSPGTQLTVIGRNTVGTLNGVAGPGEQLLSLALKGSLSPVTDSGKPYCAICLRANVELQEVSCGKHSICTKCEKDFAKEYERTIHESLQNCGRHYECDFSSDHAMQGKACQQYLCHKPNAEYHTRCKRCGGPLCSVARHGDGVCYNFDVTPAVNPPPPPRPELPELPDANPDVNPDANPDEIPQ